MIVNETNTIINQLGQQEEFLVHKTKQVFNNIYMPEIRQQMHSQSHSQTLLPPPCSPTTSINHRAQMTRRCHRCHSRFHNKKNCPRYKCQKCFQI